jgi:hypothetical protein
MGSDGAVVFGRWRLVREKDSERSLHPDPATRTRRLAHPPGPHLVRGEAVAIAIRDSAIRNWLVALGSVAYCRPKTGGSGVPAGGRTKDHSYRSKGFNRCVLD